MPTRGRDTENEHVVVAKPKYLAMSPTRLQIILNNYRYVIPRGREHTLKLYSLNFSIVVNGTFFGWVSVSLEIIAKSP